MQSPSSDPGRATRRCSLRPSAAALTGALAATLVPQTVDAALVTVGGDGGVGPVTLENFGDGTNFGGLLLDPLIYDRKLGPLGSVEAKGLRGSGIWFRAYGSAAVGAPTNLPVGFLPFVTLNAGYGFRFDSDNWVPGRFRVHGVNGGNPIWGWLHLRLGSPDNLNPTVISFTYDDEAVGDEIDTRFAKPPGGFRVTETDPVPEPSTLGLFGLGLGAAFVSRMRRRKRGG